MQSNWEKSVEFVIEQEGEYTNDSNDPGGETKWGISKKSYPTLDIKNLTQDQAKAIYESDYWNLVNGDELPNGLDLAVFDMAVNQGVGTAIKLLQKHLGTKEDGVFGPITLAKAKAITQRQILVFLARRLEAYMTLMTKNTKLLSYAINWFYRVVALANKIQLEF